MSLTVPHNPPALPELMSLDEVADLVGAHRKTIERWARAGRLPVVRLGRRLVRVRVSDLAALLERHVVAAAKNQRGPAT